ncbi:glycolate oxidase subunit GlcD [Nodularia spumigena CS-584]|jgi:glycolate oxidase|uniref:Glycolate oxidase subunit GlcD n=1 Tax=Nodularia spumigena UHCC 0060 TaxID=3110300 RepID=A0ABU5ULW6_NODSP|nr:glycolate oxidase subunit GlcD [Nodularia spumigena]AHJ31191.1 Glycolate dehydrogenase, subunit GlcD [Nodularia spumigena CCY9414]EAW43978.1 Glycolate oxidase subunit GlcD [Nodularia spumigena CCY9414]MDB9383860.1 glycolate oxidase subunit GlcD [Nodularia spumigena CS-584]MEA5524279.1 glycolate oxidase subunit GlcD [Nodularia spumigena UHCC 0143]MEA5607243.1 glycolate oxidase subunit GlcD [Nodularia spumigena UHCC 0060]
MLIQEKKQYNWKPIIKAFEAVVGKNGVVQRREELITYECDGLTSYRQRPAVVVLPRTTEQIAELVKICNKYSVTFIARGSGTGLSGGALPSEDSVLIVTSLMRQILNVDLDNQRIVVQPGVINSWVTQTVSGAGFYYAPDPSSQIICSIGGNVAENSGGVHCLKYGVTTNHVLGLKIVTPSGEILDLGGQVPEMPGYDLTGVFVGSEGTLGIATEITLRILKSAESICVLLADFTSVEAAAATVSDIISAGIIPGGMEMMDNISINAVEDVVATNCYPRDATAILLVEIDGLDVEVEVNKQRVAEICKKNGARNVTSASDLETRLKLWKGRKAAFAAAGHLSPDYYVQDGVIPRTQLTYVLQEIEALSQKFGYKIANVFHAGDGNLHPLILFDNAVPGALEKVEEVGGEILKLCVKVGGSISGEHGIGADKKCYMPDMFSPADLESMQWIRQVFNPQGLANPDKIFPTPRTCGEAANAVSMKQFAGVEQF